MPKKQETENLMPLSHYREKMVLPGKETPISTAALYKNWLPALDIKTHKIKTGGVGHAESYIKKEDGEKLLAAFRLKHWRKFKATNG